MTMQRITVPASFVEATGGDFKWPATSYAGTIRAVRVSNPKMSDRLWAGFESMDAEQISLEIANLEVLEPTQDLTETEISEYIGDRPYFIQLTVRDGSNTFENVDPTERNATNWQLQRGLRDFVRLAQALGAVETDAAGNLTPDMSLLDELNNDGGDVLGTQIGFSVVHNKRGYANLGSIFSID
jgi:hypothetical protein